MSSTVYVAYCSSNGENECSENFYQSEINRCITCNSICDASCQELSNFITQKRIQKQTGVSSSTYNNNLVPYQVTKGQNNYIFQGLPNNANNASDREKSSTSKNIQIVNRNTSCLKGSRTSLKPGCLAPPTNGVDVKHGSYERHLAKLKAKSLKPNYKTYISEEIIKRSSRVYGNKQNNISIFDYGGYKNSCTNLTNCSK